MKQFVPVDFNIECLISDRPPINIAPFKKDCLIYILNLITSIPATNKDMELVNGFVPINAATLQRVVRNYREYLDYLLENGIIITNNRYIVGGKSRGYKFSSSYSRLVKPVQIYDKSLLRTVRKHSSLPKIKATHGHLVKWYTQALVINYELAMDYIRDDLMWKVENPGLRDRDHRTGLSKDPYRQYNSALVNIEKIAGGSIGLSLDDQVGRLHSTISNIRSELRNCLTYSGAGLVSIDVKNCQPYLSTLLLNPSFWERVKGEDDVLNINDIGSTGSFTYISSSLSSFVMLAEKDKIHSGSDLQRYTALVQNGQFYEYLEAAIARATGKQYTDRKSIKAAVFQVLFTDNRFIGQAEALPKRIFKEAFPTVYEVFSMIKRRDKKNLPLLLQRIESHLVLLVITKRIAREKPRLPIFTIHDSIVTTAGNEEYVKSVMLGELQKTIGIAPQLSVDYWTPANLQFKVNRFCAGLNSVAA